MRRKLIFPHEVDFGLSEFPELAKQVRFYNGLSGSLTQLIDGTSYLIAGAGIDITTGSNGSITIEASGGSGAGDITGVTAGTGLSGGGTSGAVTLNLDINGISATLNDSTFDDDDLSPMQSFLAHAALESGENQASEWQESVQLMTMHSAKGLEFPLVFIAGMEDGLFPHTRSQLDPGGLEEERRLCYVAVTRSMKELYISYSSQRMLHGNMMSCQPSRFLYEIPNELIDDLSTEGLKPRVKKQRRTGGDSLLGKLVEHSSFGEGVVIAVEGDGDNKRVQVNFQSEGLKWLVLGYANLKIM